MWQQLEYIIGHIEVAMVMVGHVKGVVAMAVVIVIVMVMAVMVMVMVMVIIGCVQVVMVVWWW